MTRAMRQLWKEREHFLKDDRGWEAETPTVDNGRAGTNHEQDWKEPINAALGKGDNDAALHDLDSRLDAVEDFFVSWPGAIMICN